MKSTSRNPWIIADTHFGHQKIIDFESRPFHSLEEMDETLINNCNKKVKGDQDFFILGDYSFYGRDKTMELTSRLHGRKILITGNHDGKSRKFYLDCGFSEVINYPIVYEDFFILSHKPLYMNKNTPYVNIFGHVHGNPMYKDMTSCSFCVSAERTHYTPISLDEIKRKLQQIPGKHWR